MTMSNNDMVALFPDIVACMELPSLEIKKMCFLFLVNYARIKPDIALKALPIIQGDMNDSNPLVRALALRTISYIHILIHMFEKLLLFASQSFTTTIETSSKTQI
ncbi:Beta-adaptin [Blumeria graminis f. sp. tritici 96224]|nr:Beta-adaptin [Blumeria graminis f. sp. tritici 96224]